MVLGFFVFMGTGLARRDPVILAYTLAATGIVTFFALLTQFHPRFGDVVLPVIYTCSLGGCAWAARQLRLAWVPVQSIRHGACSRLSGAKHQGAK
jgi:hypothetical protein